MNLHHYDAAGTSPHASGAITCSRWRLANDFLSTEQEAFRRGAEMNTRGRVRPQRLNGQRPMGGSKTPNTERRTPNIGLWYLSICRDGAEMLKLY